MIARVLSAQLTVSLSMPPVFYAFICRLWM